MRGASTYPPTSTAPPSDLRAPMPTSAPASRQTLRLRHRFAPQDVETVATDREEPAEAGGLLQRDVDAIWESVRALYADGAHPAISFCLRRRGKVLLLRSLGHLSGNAPLDSPDRPLVPCVPDTPFCIFSASKAITALLVHVLDDQGVLHIDDAVAEYIPEFARFGKERTTIRHVLTHRAGLPSVPAERADPSLFTDWDALVQLLCDTRPASYPGRRLAYHAITGGHILGEVMRRATGRELRPLLHDELLAPMGLADVTYGIAPERLAEVAESAITGPPVPPLIDRLITRALGAPFRTAVEIAHDPRFLTSVVPAGNVICSAEQASRFFQVLLDEGQYNGQTVVEPRTIRRACNESAWREVDFTLLAPVRYGLGFQLGSDHLSVFGPGTPRAFGHLGFMNTLMWADPDREISVALLTSGKPFLGGHLLRLASIVGTIGERCLTR
jgi:CubicO group peptidase (beta-lactamase class C family)